jgi:hypothetical protein
MLINTCRLFGLDTADNSWKCKVLYSPSANATASLDVTFSSDTSVNERVTLTTARTDLCVVAGGGIYRTSGNAVLEHTTGLGDNTVSGHYVGYFHAGDTMVQQYFVDGSGTSTVTFAGDTDGHIGIWAVRLGA